MEIIIIVASFVVAAGLAAVLKQRRAVEITAVGVTTLSVVASVLVAHRVGESGVYSPYSFITVDALSAVILLIASIVAWATSLYAIPYFRKETAKKIIGLTRVKQYYALTSLFLAALFLTIVTSQPVIAWIFLEATTLSTVFLTSFYGRESTVEAAWKYMIINAVGLLVAFFGTLLYFTALGHGDSSVGLISWDFLKANAGHLSPAIAQTAFVFVLIGYGTKIGLAPMHTWKPDAYSKAPSPIGALFSGALMPVAFLVLLKFKSITDSAVGPAFSHHLLIAFGLLSVLVAAFSLLTIKNYKRMLAFSSIEHAGLVALGLGFGGIGALAALLQLVYHSLIKSSLFYLSGNILLRYHSAYIKNVRGMLSIIPATGVLFFVGLFAVTGFPPFGIFLTELFTLTAGIKVYPVIAIVTLAGIVLSFIGVFRQTSAMMFGEKPIDITVSKKDKTEGWLLVAPAALLILALVIGFYEPHFVRTLINQATIGL